MLDANIYSMIWDTYRPRKVEVESDGIIESFQFGVFEVDGVIP